MSITWFRSHHGAPSDTKLTIISRNSEQHRAFVTAVYWEIYDYASRHEDRGSLEGLDHEVIAIQQGLDCHAVSRIVTEMSQRGIITSQNRLAIWEKEQVIKEDNTASERKRRERERKKDIEKQTLDEDWKSMSQHVTPLSRSVTTDTEQNKTIVVVKDKSLLDSPRELEIVDNFEEGLDFNNIIVCFDVAVALLGKDNLDDLDRSALLAWHEIYDMKKFFVIVQGDLTKRLQKKQGMPNSLRFFEYVIKKLPAEKPPDLEKILG